MYGGPLLKSTDSPALDLALQKAGVEETELVGRIQTATDEIEIALGRIHIHSDSEEIQRALRRFGRSARELMERFPSLFEEAAASTGDF